MALPLQAETHVGLAHPAAIRCRRATPTPGRGRSGIQVTSVRLKPASLASPTHVTRSVTPRHRLHHSPRVHQRCTAGPITGDRGSLNALRAALERTTRIPQSARVGRDRRHREPTSGSARAPASIAAGTTTGRRGHTSGHADPAQQPCRAAIGSARTLKQSCGGHERFA